MDRISKFLSDIEKLKKHDRAENPSSYDGERICRKIRDLYVRNNPHMGELSSSFADYWLENYVLKSPDIKNEPSQESLDKIAALQALIDCENEKELTSALNEKDWKELCSLTDMEGEDLPLEELNSIMMIFVDHQAI